MLANPDEFESVENENICKDGRRVYVHWRNRSEYGEDGQLVGVFSVGIDVTERRQTEVAVRMKEQKFRTLFEHVTDYALVLQSQGNELVIVDLNESACQQHGYRREELLGQPITLLDPQAVPLDDERMQLIAAGKTIHFEVVHRRKDGSTFPVEAVVKMLEIDGEPVVFSIERDLTLRKQAEDEKAELEKTLQQKFKMEAIGTLAGGIAHDFNNILTIILGSAELLWRKLTDDDKNIDKVDRIPYATGRAKNLVDQVLAFGRRQEPSLEPLLLAELIDETIELLRATIPRTVELRTNFVAGTERLRINADRVQLQQVLINLCNNAVHAMQENGAIEISLAEAPPAMAEMFAYELDNAEYLLLSVSDTGTGITSEEIGKIFDPFYTTKDVGQGTGMGLAVVHGIIQSHRGMIHVDNRPGEGSSFQVMLPLSADEMAEVAADEAPLLTGTERILFVDDEEDLAIWVEELLTQQGFSPSRFSDCRVGLKQFAANPQAFDLLVTDQSMPNMSGLDLIERVREICPELPVILCSGYSTRVSDEIIQQRQINHYLPKPYSGSCLVRAIRDCLDQQTG